MLRLAEKEVSVKVGGGLKSGRGNRYKELALVISALLCVVFLTIPTVRTIRDTVNRDEISLSQQQLQQQRHGLEKELKKTRAELLMSGGQTETMNALASRAQNLEAQLAVATEQLTTLQSRLDDVHSLVRVIDRKASGSEIGTGRMVVNLAKDVLGVVWPPISAMFLISGWVSRRRSNLVTREIERTAGVPSDTEAVQGNEAILEPATDPKPNLIPREGSLP